MVKGKMNLRDILHKIDEHYNTTLKNSKIITTWKGPDKVVNDLTYLLKKELNQLYGFEAYIISKVLKISLSTFCDIAFADFEIKPKIKTKANSGRLSNERIFIEQFTVEQQDVAMKAGMATDRLNKILNGSREGFYAYEVYAIAKSQGTGLNKAFDQLYKVRYDELVKLSKETNE